MKRLIFPILLLNVLLLHAQPFEKSYPSLNNLFADDVEVNENGFTLAGFGYVNNQVRMALIHTDANGDTLGVEYPEAVVPGTGIPTSLMITTRDGCHYVAVANGETANLIKYTPGWTELWRVKNDSLNHIGAFCETSDDKLLVSGNPNGAALTKIDTSGRILWQVELPDGWPNPATKSLLETESGEILLGLYYPGSYPGGIAYNNTFYTFSSTGTLLGTASLHPNPQDQCIAGITIKVEDHFASICSFHEDKPHLVLHQPDGIILSQKEIGLPFTMVSFRKMILNSSNELVAAGTAYNSVTGLYATLIYGMTPAGDSLWLNTRQSENQFILSDLALCADGGYILSGVYEYNPETEDFYPMLIRTDPWGGNSPLHTATPELSDGLHVYPNPAIENVNFVQTSASEPGIITITDIAGKQVAAFPLNDEKIVWNTHGIQPGVYQYQLRSQHKNTGGKLMIAR